MQNLFRKKYTNFFALFVNNDRKEIFFKNQLTCLNKNGIFKMFKQVWLVKIRFQVKQV